MTDLETVGFALRRALDKQLNERFDNVPVIEALTAILAELEAIHAERGWQFEPTGLKAADDRRAD